MKIIRDNYELKTLLNEINLKISLNNNSKRIILYSTQNKTKTTLVLVVQLLVSKNRQV